MAIRFDGRVVLVTGAGAGLGRAHALGFAALGATVIVNDLGTALDGGGRSSAAAEAVAEDIRARGGAAVADAGDATDERAVAELVARTVRDRGRLDALVANAGILRDKSFGKMERGDWDAVHAVHLGGAFLLARAAWPHMREQSYGRIVLTTSSSGLYGNFGQANYAAAKMGLVGLTRTLAIEGERFGIRANALAPIAWTRMTAPHFPPGTQDLFAPEKATPGVLFLASEEAPNGVVLSAGGGAYALAEVIETPPVPVGEGPDEIAAAWPRIAQREGGETPPNAAGQTMRFFAALTRR
jgi:NAD(P)-dependent dehydrogenase (short-subunit alcohol dehydrogenase family)